MERASGRGLTWEGVSLAGYEASRLRATQCADHMFVWARNRNYLIRPDIRRSAPDKGTELGHGPLPVLPRYFFHVCNGNGFIEDEEGVELPNEAAARKQAVQGARDIMTSDIRDGELDLSSFIEVEGEPPGTALHPGVRGRGQTYCQARGSATASRARQLAKQKHS